MNSEPAHGHTVNHILPFALFGFLAPIATYLVAVSNLLPARKTAILSLMAGLYVLLFFISYKRLRTVETAKVTVPTFTSEIAARDHLEDTYKDEVTGFADLRSFEMVLEHEIAETVRSSGDRPLSLLAIGIEQIEEHSELTGKVLNDRLLLFVAETIKRNLREMDFAARAGEEFLVVLPSANLSGANEISRRIEKSFAEHPFSVSDREHINLRVFVGFAGFDHETDTPESFIRAARALKEEKRTRLIQAAEHSSRYLH